MTFWIVLAVIILAIVIVGFEAKRIDVVELVRSQAGRFRDGIQNVAQRRAEWSSFQDLALRELKRVQSEAKNERLFEYLYVDHGKLAAGEPNFVTLLWGAHPTGVFDWRTSPRTLDVESGCALHFVQGLSGEVACIIYPFGSPLRVPDDKFHFYRLFRSPSDIGERELNDTLRAMFAVAQYTSYAANPGWEDRYVSIGNGGDVPHVLMAGATGVGKSRLIQHLLQTTAANFPMRGAGRTTVSDGEIIVGDFDFSAVITFFSKNEIREIVKENILEACSFANKDSEDKAKIASKLLVDSDKRFRFNHVLGGWPAAADVTPDDDIISDEDEMDSDEEAASAPLTWPKLEHCVDQVVAMTEAALEKARAQIDPASEQDEDAVDEALLQNIDRDHLGDLTEEILDELERRLCAATGDDSWPVIHEIEKTEDQEEFFEELAPFYQNHRSLFGTLVTPLVQGIRSRGRFYPPSWAADESPTWVLIDGQGIGHEQSASTKIDRIVPPELASKFSGADVICLVDRAVPAMVGDAPVLLQHLVTRGYLDRLALVFTHFEAVNAPDLDARGKRDKVLEGLSNAIQAIAILPKGQKVLLERTAEERAYFLAHLDFDELKFKATRAGLRDLCDRISSTMAEPELQPARPLYNEYQIANVVRSVIAAYRQDWSARELAGYQYKIMEALTNWISNAFRDGYPKRNLYPGQDLAQRLVSAISVELENPKGWNPRNPQNAEEESRILNAIRTKVADDVDSLCRDALIRDPRTIAWQPAYEHIYGKGTQVRRARAIARILEDHAQLPDEGVGKFTKDVWQIVENAVAEVCEADEETDAPT